MIFVNMSVNKYVQLEQDCTEKCKSKRQASQLFPVLTKRCVSDAEICSYLSNSCSNCGIIHDCLGRTALHFAASCGRTQVIKWLTSKRNAQINFKDFESGYTALHRSVFYGKINSAVALIQLGVYVNLFFFSARW